MATGRPNPMPSPSCSLLSELSELPDVLLFPPFESPLPQLLPSPQLDCLLDLGGALGAEVCDIDCDK
jgi:hypothetical protein